MEHVLFVIIYAATLNSHKLLGLADFVFCLMTKTTDWCTKINVQQERSHTQPGDFIADVFYQDD